MSLKSSVKRHESYKQFPYLDCCGKPWRDCTCVKKGWLTVGWGRNLDTEGISEEEADHLLDNDLARVHQVAFLHYRWFGNLNLPRQDVILEMMFNLGISKFDTFKKLISAIDRQDYIAAANEMLASVWASQVKMRAVELANKMRTGVDPEDGP